MPHEVMLLELVQSVLFAFVMIVLGYPIVRMITRRVERRPVEPALYDEISRRLEHLETIAEATAIEVERISEGQRFVSRILASQPAGERAVGSGRNGT